MSINVLGIYRPVWAAGRHRVAGPDEDLVTLAVSAASVAGVAGTTTIDRVVLVTPTPDVLDGLGVGVLLRSLGLSDGVATDLRIGGAPTTLDVLLGADDGTLVITVDLTPSSCVAVAALIGSGAGPSFSAAGRHTGSLPMRIRRVGSPDAVVYQDPRVERELASAPLFERLKGDGRTVVAGLPPKDAQRLGAEATTVVDLGASAPLLLLAELAGESDPYRVVALDAATAVAVDVVPGGSMDVRREERPALAAERRPVDTAPDTVIPFAMPAYARAFEAKIGMTAARCVCGEVSFPPRLVCLDCGRHGETSPFDLPRTGEVYTAVTVHVPIPGVAGKYALAIVSLDDSPVRVLARLTDMDVVEPAIGARGRLVLRRIAQREGVPDYGYALQLDTTEEVA